MQQYHLTAWQAHAPWPKRSQVEQDLRLSRGVAAIFGDETLSDHLAMRGGTVLHKGHLSPATRYSEDIDLVLTKRMGPDDLEKHLNRVLVPVLGTPAPSVIADAWLAVRNVMRPSRILRIAFKFIPVGLRLPQTIKVEVNLSEHKALYPLVTVGLRTMNEDGDILTADARSYDLNEMLGTKTRALMQRKQGRDLYDLWHAWELSQAGTTLFAVDGKKAMEAFEWYLSNEGTGMGRQEAEALLAARLKDGKFRADMRTLLRPGLLTFDVDAAADVVRSAYLSKLSAA